MPDSFFKLLDDLIKPGNWPFLAAFVVALLVLVGLIALAVAAAIRQDGLNYSFKVLSLWIHLKSGPDDPKAEKRGYRKLLYVKVNYLTKQGGQTPPCYKRIVNRLDEQDRLVPVYDEAVYYTLKLFPGKRTLEPEQDSSSGVVDPRLLIPWLNQIGFRTPAVQHAKELVDIDAKEQSDTMLSVSHFLNGLQGRNQDFETYADEDAESLRLVVDFSSIPNASDLIKIDDHDPNRPWVQLLVDQRPSEENDDLKYAVCGASVYMAHCKNVKKGSLLKMSFVFTNWASPG
jgi:hypothetical protein